MQCFSDAGGRLQESVLDAATKGNSCLRRNINSRQRTGLKFSLMMIKKGGKVKVTNVKNSYNFYKQQFVRNWLFMVLFFMSDRCCWENWEIKGSHIGSRTDVRGIEKSP
ncbi:PREDICTED: uncharacterized protein LOC105124439 [Populus euphratica]|uniref:Uncharacterized protein LOC105124439 n=1 Tax=Populus euphratica TaxID=75702 RepID=A0AAJ6U4Q4_POPEU|nr:PREDICTED: uncharacterized protein LOC105124439 [Populus euphratica]